MGRVFVAAAAVRAVVPVSQMNLLSIFPKTLRKLPQPPLNCS